MVRQVFDKRTLRRKYGGAFAAAIGAAHARGTFLDELAAQLGGSGPAESSGDEPVQARSA